MKLAANNNNSSKKVTAKSATRGTKHKRGLYVFISFLNKIYAGKIVGLCEHVVERGLMTEARHFCAACYRVNTQHLQRVGSKYYIFLLKGHLPTGKPIGLATQSTGVGSNSCSCVDIYHLLTHCESCARTNTTTGTT